MEKVTVALNPRRVLDLLRMEQEILKYNEAAAKAGLKEKKTLETDTPLSKETIAQYRMGQDAGYFPKPDEGTLERHARVAAGAAAGGTASILGAGKDISDLIGAGIDWLKTRVTGKESAESPPKTEEPFQVQDLLAPGRLLFSGRGVGSADIKRGMDETAAAVGAPGVLNRMPLTTGEGYTEAIARNAPAAALPFGGYGMVTRQIAGALPSAAGEFAAQAFGDKDTGTKSETARLLTELPLDLIIGYGMGRPTNASRAAQEHLAAFPEEAYRAAAAEARRISKETGIPITTSQLLTDRSNYISALSHGLSETQAGRIVRRWWEQQSDASVKAGNRFVNAVEPGVSPTDPAAGQRILTRGRTALVDTPNEVATQYSKPFYTAAEQDLIPNEVVQQLRDTLQGIPNDPSIARAASGKKAMTAAQAVASEVEDATTRTTTKKLMQRPDGIFDLVDVETVTRRPIPATKLDDLAADQAAEMNRIRGLDQNVPTDREYRVLAKTKSAIDDVALGASENLAQGRAIQKIVRDAIHDPRQRSLLREFFPESATPKLSGRVAEDYPLWRGVLQRENNPERIRFAAQRLLYEDQKAAKAAAKSTQPAKAFTGNSWPQLVKNWIADSWEGANVPKAGRRPDTFMGDFATELAGAQDSMKRAGFREKMRWVAKSMGVPEEEYIKASEDLMDAFTYAARDRGKVIINEAEFAQQAGTNLVSTGLKSMSVVPMHPTGTIIERTIRRKAYKELAEALTDPAKVDKLLKIRAKTPGQQALEAWAWTLMGMKVRNPWGTDEEQ